jgi:ribonucleotide monophosphatase NagD (HAD superfamily)
MSLSPRAVLLDLDGVLYVEDEPVPGAAEAVERIRAGGLTLRFVTNTTSHSRGATLEKLSTSASHTTSSTARFAICSPGLS